MITLSFKPGTNERVLAAFRARGPQLVEGLTSALDEAMLLLQQRIQQKLSGEVLQNRGGALLGSVRKNPTVFSGTTITGGVQAGSAKTAAYAAVQEFGGTRQYEILPGILTGKSDKKALSFFPEGATAVLGAQNQILEDIRSGGVRRKPRGASAFFQSGGVVVKKVIHPPLPERSYLRSSLEELRSEIIARIYRAAAKAVS